jgi:hypothetical protein
VPSPNEISQKAVDPNKLIKLQNDVVQYLVSFEMVFPPLFFNITTHLQVYIVKEINILGPVFLHNIFPFERYMAVLKKYVRNCSRPEINMAVHLSDYDCSIMKSYEKKDNRWYNQVPQLREQPNQMIPPLKVLLKEDEATTEFVVGTNLSKGQLQGNEEVPTHPGSGRKPFVMREPLIWPELLHMLPTRMRELHD